MKKGDLRCLFKKNGNLGPTQKPVGSSNATKERGKRK